MNKDAVWQTFAFIFVFGLVGWLMFSIWNKDRSLIDDCAKHRPRYECVMMLRGAQIPPRTP